MIQFIEIEFENFLSFYGFHSYKFDNNGLHIIKGHNLDSAKNDINLSENDYSVGSGKSSFTFVIQYALFGIIEKKLKKKDKVINKEAGNNLYVSLTLSIDGDIYKIKRYRKHTQFSDGLFFEKYENNEWVDITATSKDATQQKINDLIIINNETFLKITLFTREDDSHFFELTLGERSKIFDNIIQLNKFNKYIKRIKKKLKETKKNINEINNDNIRTQAEINLYKNQLKEERSYANIKIKEKETYIKDYKEDIEMFSDITPEIIEKIKEYKNILNQINEKKKEYNNYNNETTRYSDACGVETNIIEREEELIKKYNDQIKKLTNKKNKCPSCNTEFNTNDELDQINDLNECILKSNKRIEKSQKTKEEKSKLYNIEIKKAQKSAEELDELRNKLNDYKKYKKYENITEENIAEIQKIHEKIKKEETDISTIKYELSEKEKRIINKISELDLILNTFEQTTFILETKLKMLEWWEEVFDLDNEQSIKNYIVSKIIPVFNNILNEHLKYAFEGMTITVNNLLEETIIKDGDIYDYHELSTGERLKLNLCSNFTIFDLTRMNLNGTNLIFMDEIFNNVDFPTISRFMELIKKKYTDHSATYMISHLSSVNDQIEPKSITIIEKEDKRSKIRKAL